MAASNMAYVAGLASQSLWSLSFAVLMACCASYVVYYRWLHPVAKFPGPLICALSNMWKLWAVVGERMPEELLKLHEKYGPVVRIGPNDLSFNAPEAVADIYKRGWQKGDMYTGFQHRYSGLFDERDEKLHAQRKRLVGPSLSIHAIRAMETAMDTRYAILRQQLDKFADTGELFDLSHYIAYCIADTLGQLAFSEAFGSQIEQNPEKIPPVSDALFLNVASGQIPWATRIIKNSPFLKDKKMLAGVKRIVPLAMENINLRSVGKIKKNDILGNIIAAREEKIKQPLAVRQVLAEATDLIVGGTDTTIQTTNILFANLGRNPEYLRRFVDEIDNNLPPLQHNQAACSIHGLEEKLDFVHAAIRESCRKNPVAAFNMPRAVPAQGGQIAGYKVPPGSQVFVNIHALHHNPSIWGANHGTYDPSRWYDGRANKLKEFVIPFMVGKRSCIGQNLASANILKMVTTLLKAYEFEFVNAEEPMRVTTHGVTSLRTPILVKCKMRSEPLKI